MTNHSAVPEQLVGDDQRTDRVVAGAPAGVPDDVGVAFAEAGVLGRVEPGVHAGEDGEPSCRRQGELGLPNRSWRHRPRWRSGLRRGSWTSGRTPGVEGFTTDVACRVAAGRTTATRSGSATPVVGADEKAVVRSGPRALFCVVPLGLDRCGRGASDARHRRRGRSGQQHAGAESARHLIDVHAIIEYEAPARR